MRTLSLFVILLTLINFGLVQGQVNAQISVEEYYFLLPESYFYCDEIQYTDSKENRQSMLSLTDPENDFLEANVYGGKLYVLIFKDHVTQLDNVLVYLNCGRGCICNVFDIQYYTSEGTWAYSEDLLPWEEVNELIFKMNEQAGKEFFPDFIMPRGGNIIVAQDLETGQKMFDLEWNGQKFILRKN